MKKLLKLENMDIKEIQNLIKFVAKSGASEVKLETGDIKITIRTGSDSSATETTTYVQQAPVAVQPVQQQQVQPQEIIAPVAKSESDDAKYVTIKSPMIGTFYRKPAPDKPTFVEVGSSIKPGSALCVIEAMKLFNEIESEVSGTIVKILVDDSSPVEFDQPLFLIDPS